MLTTMGADDGAFPSALSSDEVCAAARLAGIAPLPLFATGWAPEEAGVAGAVALRGLLARGLAVVREPEDGPGLTPAARWALEPLLVPGTLVEIRRDEGPLGRRRHVLGETGERRVLAAERMPSIWDLMMIGEPVGTVTRTLVDPLIPDHGQVPPRQVTASGRALAAAETLLAQDGAARLPRMLEGHGLDGPAAQTLATALSSARVLVTVRIVRRDGTDARTADALTWLDAGPSGLWLVTPAEPPGDPDADDEPAADTYTLSVTDRATVRDALAGLFDPADLKEERCLTTT
jgi:hypothetical protein